MINYWTAVVTAAGTVAGTITSTTTNGYTVNGGITSVSLGDVFQAEDGTIIYGLENIYKYVAKKYFDSQLKEIINGDDNGSK